MRQKLTERPGRTPGKPVDVTSGINFIYPGRGTQARTHFSERFSMDDSGSAF